MHLRPGHYNIWICQLAKSFLPACPFQLLYCCSVLASILIVCLQTHDETINDITDYVKCFQCLLNIQCKKHWVLQHQLHQHLNRSPFPPWCITLKELFTSRCSVRTFSEGHQNHVIQFIPKCLGWETRRDASVLCRSGLYLWSAATVTSLQSQAWVSAHWGFTEMFPVLHSHRKKTFVLQAKSRVFVLRLWKLYCFTLQGQSTAALRNKIYDLLYAVILFITTCMLHSIVYTHRPLY